VTVGIGVLAPVAPARLRPAFIPRRAPVRSLAKTPSVLSDEDLVRTCQSTGAAGRDEAFRELVERYQDRAFWIAKGMVRNPDDARDVAQDAFIRVFKSVERFDPKLKFYTWFYQIVVNLSIDHLRRSKKRTRLSIDDLGENGEGTIEGKSDAPDSASERDELADVRAGSVHGRAP
jgi:RNA polymerase sigma-70 factor, ECF subfamily